ncbi:MAG: hypothetical protein DHS20C12_13590 [Pseudohongiella sp.]|nr:MAG: hypothetical protein DHS20C12_13590 [Pseudohongiella sp.]
MGDETLNMDDDTTVIGVGQIAVEEYFAFPSWPSISIAIELGGRSIEILPIPGHSDDDLAFYDATSQVLITGDTLYPGRLYVRNWPAYRESIRRLAGWTMGKSISHVLGTHIEMSALPNTDYPIGTTYQADEHQLPLSVSDIFTLRDALDEYERPEKIPLGSFIIWPI